MSTVTDFEAIAPVIACQEIEIHAPLDQVWGLHVDASAWSAWNPAPNLGRPWSPGAAHREGDGGDLARSWHVGTLTGGFRIL